MKHLKLFENFKDKWEIKKEKFKKEPHTIKEIIDSDYILDFISEMYGDDWGQMDFDGQELSIYGLYDEETGELIDETDDRYDFNDMMNYPLLSWDISEIKDWFEKNGFIVK